MVKKKWVTWIVVLAVIILAVVILTRPHPETSEEIAKCIGDNSVLYVQLGCHACETQEKMFGDNYQHLNVVDCFFDSENCMGVRATPTWKINGELIVGVQTIETLQELTGCE